MSIWIWSGFGIGIGIVAGIIFRKKFVYDSAYQDDSLIEPRLARGILDNELALIEDDYFPDESLRQSDPARYTLEREACVIRDRNKKESA